MAHALLEQSPAPVDLQIRPLEAPDLEAVHALSVAVLWPHRLTDWQFVAALGQGVVVEHAGRIVGTGQAWKFGEDHATVGLVIVAPDMQGQRIGQRVMHALLEALPGRTVSLQATAEGRGLYERLGFVQTGEVRQHQGLARPARLMAPPPGLRLRPLVPSDVESLVALDHAASGMPRGAALRALLQSADGVVLDDEGEAVGFALARRFGRGHAIGPVVAPDIAGAQVLIAHWTSTLAQKFVRIDVDAGSGLLPWLEDQGLHRVGAVTTMVRGAAPLRGPAHGLFALINQALG